MLFQLIIALFLSGCTGLPMACYAQADARYLERVAACPGTYDECPDRELIEARLRAEQEACK